MKLPHDPHELRVMANQAVRVPIQPQLIDVWDPLNAVKAERHITGYVVRFLDRRSPHFAMLEDKIELAPGLWIHVAAALDHEEHFWAHKAHEVAELPSSQPAAQPSSEAQPAAPAAPTPLDNPPAPAGPLRDGRGRFVKRRTT